MEIFCICSWIKNNDMHGITWSLATFHLLVQWERRKLIKWKNSIFKSGLACEELTENSAALDYREKKGQTTSCP